MSRKLSIYVTVSFWACIGMAWVNLVLMFIAKHTHSPALLVMAAGTFLVCAIGAGAHWLLERAYARRR